MKWKRNTGFDQIEDRRGQAVGGGGGGANLGALLVPLLGTLLSGKAGKGGIVLIIAIVAVVLFSGVLGGGGGLGLQAGGGGGVPGGTLVPQSDTDQQLSYIVDNIQDYWARTFSASGRDYPETVLVLFKGGTDSPCGPASSATGPFYCPADQKVYLDLGFFDELKARFGAQGGDFAMAYVVGHEFGHHIQTVLGISDQVQQMSQQDPSRQNLLSVRQELQADCFAGTWANAAIADIEPGDIPEAIDAAAAVGDDRIQQATSGRVDPEGWTHGSAEQRVAWFTKGHDTGNPEECDTFAS